ncbi:MAG TPA: sigma 54-interacting transcriptional regulator [Kofleriaceae bacterium]|nr:sigma 54-interacting transcriptional regulator [Kofleriaceae bacterium]
MDSRGAESVLICGETGKDLVATGTLFFDEIGAAPPELRAMVLRALETSEIYRQAPSAPSAVDVRIIAATDARPEDVSTTRGDASGSRCLRGVSSPVPTTRLVSPVRAHGLQTDQPSRHRPVTTPHGQPPRSCRYP